MSSALVSICQSWVFYAAASIGSFNNVADIDLASRLTSLSCSTKLARASSLKIPTSRPFSLIGRVVDSESPEVDVALVESCLNGILDGPAAVEDVWFDMTGMTARYLRMDNVNTANEVWYMAVVTQHVPLQVPVHSTQQARRSAVCIV